ncbi:hypothetical protein KX729_09285 [Rhizobium sp. XQZ8]|uniref:hypothetical protein n=1 Tax=Rhizobium populisoli TaxID=2859785 RepID=UPI001CA4AD42|nr:hypothetical protein [Rhizobium populisoli]MBW6421632.1 hypothetical protein [Rhizobium populisoli]
MSRAIGKHFGTIKQQRQILADWAAWEYEIDRSQRLSAHANAAAGLYGLSRAVLAPRSFNTSMGDYHRILDLAESRLKIAASIGSVVDISATSVGQDALCVIDAARAGAQFGSKQRIRDNLVAYDFMKRFGRDVDVSVSKTSLLRIAPPNPASSIEDLATIFLSPTYEPLVLASFKDPADAMVYRLAI